MGLTILAIPFIAFGVFVKPYPVGDTRCIGVGAARPYCFEKESNLPEVIKYGSALAGFALLYAGRRQIKRQRDAK